MSDTWRSPLGCTSYAADVKPFRAWCKRRKVLWGKCQISQSDSTGRCVAATEAILEGELAVEVPDDAVLMSENSSIAEELAAFGLMKPAEDAILEVQGLIIAVMYEQALGKKSRWGPYLEYLPKQMDHMPMFWEESEVSELVGTAAADKMKGRVQHPADAPTRVAQLFEEVVLPFCQQHMEITQVMMKSSPASSSAAAAAGGDGGSSSKASSSSGSKGHGLAEKGRKGKKRGRGDEKEEQEEEGLTEEEVSQTLWPLYQWSTAVVASYSFVLGDDHFQAMVPVWDLLNHITGKVNVRLHHDADKGVLQMIATADIPAGAEVVNCYGQLSSAELLRGYGFVEMNNSNEHVQIPAHFLAKAAAAAKAASAAEEGTAAAAAAGGERPGGKALDAADGEADHAAGSDEDEDGDSDSDSESEMPDFELEDDSEAEADAEDQTKADTVTGAGAAAGAAAGAVAARSLSLHKAMALLGEGWEEAWLVGHQLRLLPKNGVFNVGKEGGPGAALLAVLQLLLLSERELGKLQTVVDKVGRKKQGEMDEEEVDKKSQGVQWASQGTMRTALLQLADLMLSRYSCSLAEDEKLLQQLEELPPRKQAAVVARAAEKRCLVEMKERVVGGGGGEAAAGGEWQQQVEAAVKEGLKGLAQRRAEKRKKEEEGEEEEKDEDSEEEVEPMGHRKEGRGKHGGHACQDKSCCVPRRRKQCDAEETAAADGGGGGVGKKAKHQDMRQSREDKASSEAAAVGFSFNFAV